MPDFLSLSLWLCGRVGGTGVFWGYVYVFVRVEVYVRVQVLFERRCVCGCSGVYAYVYLRMSLCICSSLSLCENTLIANPPYFLWCSELKCALTTPSVPNRDTPRVLPFLFTFSLSLSHLCSSFLSFPYSHLFSFSEILFRSNISFSTRQLS